MIRTTRILLLGLAVTALASAQGRRLQHYDGTTEYTSRGNLGVAPGTVLQRIPWDQAAGAVALSEVVFTVQDQDALTPEVLTFELRANSPFFPAGAPDMGPPGLIGAIGPVVVVFPGAGISAVELTFLGPVGGIPLPAAIGVPAGDWYLGLTFPASPLWPAMDGISLHISAALAGTAGEQMNPIAPGYAGFGLAGLGWTFNAVTGVLALGTGNRAWVIGGRYERDVVQPYASNPAAFTAAGMPVGDGADPNLGYAGIFPMGVRFDALGFRVRTLAPVGTPTGLILGTTLFAGPIFFPPGPGSLVAPGSAGLLVDVSSPDTLFFGFGGFLGFPPVPTIPAPATEPAAVSDAWWGPFGLPPFFVGITLYVQGIAATPAGLFTISTLCRVTL